MLERQIRYNLRTSTGEQDLMRHRWTFMIINEPREIVRIRERIYQELQPVCELKDLFEGPLRNTNGLHYDFFSFSSERGRIYRPENIYKSEKFSKDRNLVEGDEIRLERYLISLAKGR